MKGPPLRQWVAWLMALPLRLYIRKIRGKEHLPRGACVLACSHGSILDGPLVAHAIWPRPLQALVDDTYAKIPVVGSWLRLVRVLWVDWNNPGKVVPEAVQAVREGYTLIVFPDGGLADNVMTHPKTGAARIALQAGVPLVPLRLIGSQRIMLRSGFPHFRRADIIIGKVMDTRSYDADSRKDVRLLTKKLSQTINALR